MATIKKVLLWLAMACGTGCNPGPYPPENPTFSGLDPAAPVADPLGGYLSGNLYLDGGLSSEHPIAVMLTEDSRFRTLAGEADDGVHDFVLRGTYRLHGRLIDGQGIAIAGSGWNWSDGTPVTAISISGTLDHPTSTNNGRLAVSVSMDSGDSGRIEAEFQINSSYWRHAELGRLLGDWIAAKDASWYPGAEGAADSSASEPEYMRIAIALDGNFSGTDDSGCALAGRFSPIDVNYSLWSVAYTVTDCELAGGYSGLMMGPDTYAGWYPDGWAELHFTADDGVRSMVRTFHRDAVE